MMSQDGDPPSTAESSESVDLLEPTQLTEDIDLTVPVKNHR